ncbi:MAG: HTH-type transcriptional repressor CytR [Candidatus Celerinatantimonas neptuna]|nr:MAG: HTH-type transcriptional repressor CytR [Candidatus Celerinatantimonas neptuna]
MRKKKVTMKDIAVLAGVSQPTVSIVLNDSDNVRISHDTRERVISAAKQLEYQIRRPTSHHNKHHLIAFIVNNLAEKDPFLSALKGTIERAREFEYAVAVLENSKMRESQQTFIDELESGNYGAVIYANNTYAGIEPLNFTPSLPTVMLNCFYQTDKQVPCIIPADLSGGFQVTQHLLKQGYKRIAFIGENLSSVASQKRLDGYRQALLQNDYVPDDSLIRFCHTLGNESYRQTQELLNLSPPPDAIFCASDLMAIGCYLAIAHAGLQIPNDIAVAGFENQSLADKLTPQLTSFHLPYYEMGKLAVDCLLDRNAGNYELPIQQVEGELCIGDSTTQH